MIPPERPEPTPADRFDAYLREVDARETAHPLRRAGLRPSRSQLATALVLGLVLWGVILAGLSRTLLGWP